MSDETLAALRDARRELERTETAHFRYRTATRDEVEKARAAYLKARDEHSKATTHTGYHFYRHPDDMPSRAEARAEFDR